MGKTSPAADDDAPPASAASEEKQATAEPAEAGGGSGSGSGSKDEGGAGDLSAISRELAETEALIQAQQQKLAQLAQLRREFLAGRRGGVTVQQAMASAAAATTATAGGQGGGAGGGDDGEWGTSVAEFLVPRARLNASAGLSAVTLASFACRNSKAPAHGEGQQQQQQQQRRAPAVVQLVVLATADGQLVFHEADTGYEILSVRAGHPGAGARSTALAMAQHGDSPILLAGGSDGTLVAHRLTLWRDGAVVAGRAPAPVRDPTGDLDASGAPLMLETPRPAAHPTSGFALDASVVGSGSGLGGSSSSSSGGGGGGGSDDEPDAAAKDAAATSGSVTAVAVYTRRKQRLAIVALDSGAVHAHRLNGTLVGRYLAPGPVADIAIVGARLALAVGTGVRFLNLHTLKEQDDAACHGSLSDVRSLATQTGGASGRGAGRGTLYATTAAGELLAFNTMAPAAGGGGKHRGDASFACRALRKLGPAIATAAGGVAPPHGRGSTATVRSGYVLLAAAAQLAVRNVSDGLRAVNGGALPFGEHGSAAGPMDGSSVVVSSGGAPARRGAAVFVAVATLGSAAPSQITVFQSLLPSAGAGARGGGGGGGFDLSTIRNIAMGVVLLGVVGWQLMGRRRSANVAAQFNDPAFMQGFQDFQNKRGAAGMPSMGGGGGGGGGGGRGPGMGRGGRAGGREPPSFEAEDWGGE